MRKIYLLVWIFLSNFLQAQVTLRVTSIPANTPANSIIYVAGTFNNWNPQDSQSILQPDGLGAYIITIPQGTGTAEYKFTRGAWSSVEGNATGNYLPNRTFVFSGSAQQINLTIQSWEDLGGTSTSTAASNVQILSPNFFMPQLNKSRKIWLYLPPDYQTSNKTYPVLYMHDGQNLFDNATSFSGEWQVDETLNSLFNAGDYGAIVVGIDNGGADRLNEYSPWVNTSYGGGQGTQYMQFVAETLKPFIDLNYRTKPQPQYNALIGSSMGAFISAYGAVAYANVFSKIGVFSPAFWFAKTDLDSYISNTTQPLNQARIYFVAGTNESTTMVSDCNQIKNSFLNKGVTTTNVFTKYDSYGAHNENYWKGEFAGAYQWLFQNELLQVDSVTNTESVIIFTRDNNFYVSGLEHKTEAILFDLTGKNLGKIELSNGENKLNIDLSTGIYVLKSSDFLLKFSKK